MFQSRFMWNLTSFAYFALSVPRGTGFAGLVAWHQVKWSMPPVLWLLMSNCAVLCKQRWSIHFGSEEVKWTPVWLHREHSAAIGSMD